MAHWRDTGRPVQVFGMDAIAILPIFIFALHWSWWTFMVALTTIVFFKILQMRGVNLQQAAYRIRSRIAGRYRYARRPFAGKMRMARSILGRDYREG